MVRKRKKYSRQFKFKVALEALRGQVTINEIASQYQIHPNLVRSWKKNLTENGAQVYERKSGCNQKDLEEKEAELYEQIGRLKMELEWLKKSYRIRWRIFRRGIRRSGYGHRHHPRPVCPNRTPVTRSDQFLCCPL